MLNLLITDRVHSTTGRLCLSVCPHLGGGGTPARSRQGDTPARSRWGVLLLGVPHLGYPLSDLAGGTPPWVPPVRPGWDGTPYWPWPGGYPILGTPHQTWPGVPHLWYPPSALAGGYPTSGNR